MQAELGVELRFRNNTYRLDYQAIDSKSRTCAWDFPTLLTEYACACHAPGKFAAPTGSRGPHALQEQRACDGGH